MRPLSPTAEAEPDSAPLPATFTALYRAHYAFVWRCARRLGASDGDIDDVVQETFMVALRRLCEFDDGGPSHPPSWLFSILRNVVRNHSRGRRRHARKLEAMAVEREHHRATLPPERGAMGSLAHALLDDFVDSLDEDHRAVYVLAELEGHSSREIGEALDISPNTARSRLRSARAAFERRFDGDRRAALTRALRRRPEPPRERQRATLQAIAALEAGHLGVGAGGAGLASVAWGSLWAKLGLGLALGFAVVTGAVAAVRAPRVDEAARSTRASAGALEVAAAASARPPAAVSVEASGEAPIVVSAPSPTVASRAGPQPTANARQPAAPVASEVSDASAPVDGARAEALAVLATARTALIEQRPADGLAALDGVSRWPDPTLARRALAAKVGALCALGRAAEAEAAVEAWTGSTLPEQLMRACW